MIMIMMIITIFMVIIMMITTWRGRNGWGRAWLGRFPRAAS